AVIRRAAAEFTGGPVQGPPLAFSLIGLLASAAVYPASQHIPLLALSCTVTGNAAGSVERSRLASLPVTEIRALPSAPSLRTTFWSPSGLNVLSLYLYPLPSLPCGQLRICVIRDIRGRLHPERDSVADWLIGNSDPCTTVSPRNAKPPATPSPRRLR